MLHLRFLFLVCFMAGSARATAQNALLWAVNHEDMPDTSYIFGTMHIIPAEDFFFPEEFMTALKSCKNLVTEIDLKSDLGQLDVSQLSQMEHTSLKNLYGKKEYHQLKNAVKKKYDLDLEELDHIKPIFISQMLSKDEISTSEPMYYELYLMLEALSAGLDMSGLETLDEQVSLLDSIPLRVQADMLYEAVMTTNQGEGEYKKMVHLYKNQQLDSLYTMIYADKNIYNYSGSLIDHRNIRWIPKIETFIRKEPCFIAVGAGHLGGKNGILNLLRQKGYIVKPVLIKN